MPDRKKTCVSPAAPDHKKTYFSPSMIVFEFRTITGNPYVHIFGVGMPVLMAFIIILAMRAEISDSSALTLAATSVFLGMGTMIPLAVILLGYSATYSQELEKGIPQRMALFGIPPVVTMLNRIAAEGIFLLFALGIYFAAGLIGLEVELPVVSGFFCYLLCILLLGVVCFLLAHSIASFFQKFGITYCISMLLYFGIMAMSGLMGIRYEMLPAPLQACSRLLPTTYIAKDFADVWMGKSYNFMPLIQAYLFTGAAAGILLFITMRKNSRKKFEAS